MARTSILGTVPAMSKSRILRLALIVLIPLAIGWQIAGRDDTLEREQISYSALIARAEAGEVASAVLNDDQRSVLVTLHDGTEIESSFAFTAGGELAEALRSRGVEVEFAPPSGGSLISSLIVGLLPILLLFALLWFFMRGRGSFASLGKGRNARVEVPQTSFADVAGVPEVVEELGEIVEYLADPKSYAATGALAPRGVLLEGPPGTGKTLLARAVAGQAGVPFFSVSGSEFIEIFAGVGPARVRKLFAEARKAGRAIIFIDELDAIGRARTGVAHGGQMESENTLNQLLVEMDGFTGSNVIVLAATNRSDVLDAALLRPGRFDRRIAVPLPDRRGRAEVLRVHTRGRALADGLDLESLARRTTGMSGADLANLVNQAALLAAKAKRDVLTAADFDEALAVVMLGRERRSAALTDRDRQITAWHEAGHALTALLAAELPDPVSATVVPRGHAGGVTWLGGTDESYATAAEIQARLRVLMAGRVGEERLLDGDFTQGAASDFQHATTLATAMVCEWGMSRLGPARRDAKADEVAPEVDHILSTALTATRTLLSRHATQLEALANQLLESETLTGEEMRALLERS
jgi:cell division protease FtsH